MYVPNVTSSRFGPFGFGFFEERCKNKNNNEMSSDMGSVTF